VHKGITICIMSETHTDSFKTVYCLCTLHLTNVQVQKQIPAASSVPRRALSDITNLLHPLQDASPPRRTKSIDDDEGRPLHSRMSPLQRWGSVVLTQVGFKATEVIPIVGASRKGVKRWAERYEDDGEVEDDFRPGRQKLLDEKTTDALVSAAVSQPLHGTPREIKHLFALSCSPKTIRRVLDDAGIFGRIARLIPPAKPHVLKQRVSFGEGYKNMDWTTVLWSDEMSIHIGPQGQHWVQRPLGEAFNPIYCLEKEKHPPKVHVWGCMASAGVGRIHVFTENLDGELYKQILKDHLMKSRDMFWPNGLWHFQQDNDPKHTSKVATAYLERELCIKDYIIKWPPYSPDLNPIENLWANLKKRVEKHNTTTTEELEKAVRDEWAATDKELCKKLVASMPNRIERLLEYEGGPTGY
jgi:transposase